MSTKFQNHLYRLVASALMLALALVLPFLTGQIPQIGSMLCPMHLPVLLCGFLCGPVWALVVGALAPLLRNLLFGMPPIYPTGLAMACELAVYGLTAGLLNRALPKKSGFLYVSLVGAMLAGRAVWGCVMWALMGAKGNVFTWQAFLAGAFTKALPGIAVQLILVPVLVMALRRARLSPEDRK